MEETGCEVICGAPTPPVVKGQVKKVKEYGSRDVAASKLFFFFIVCVCVCV